MNPLQLLDILKLGESEDLECKKSKNEVPKSLWDTYSAMANTNGGIILLGIDEVDNELIITGVENVDKVIKDFWSTLNGEKVNKNILKNEENVIFLDASVETIISHLQNERNKRPLLKECENLNIKIEELLSTRYEKYRNVSDILIDINGKNIDEVISQILVYI